MRVGPMLFSAPMIRGLIREANNPGTGKSQTRRIVNDAPDQGPPEWYCDKHGDHWHFVAGVGSPSYPARVRYKPGDLIWARETWCFMPDSADGMGDEHYFKASQTNLQAAEGLMARHDVKWRPSRHMPRRVNRITLKVTDVRVQRLQDISEDDARAEGIETDFWDMAPVARHYGRDDAWFVGWSMGVDAPNVSVDAERVGRESYRTLWDSINNKAGRRWNDNPWVAAYTFTVHKQNIDAYLAKKEAA